jgi:signal peptidase II
MLKKFQQQLFLVIGFGLALFIGESIIKYYIILDKIPRQGFYFFSGLLQIDFFTNQNIAFGLPLPQALIIILIILILIFLSFFWYLSLFQQKIGQLIALSLIILGSLSNLLDRLLFGYVIDYINIFIWPVFNLADAMIVTGIILYLILNFKK